MKPVLVSVTVVTYNSSQFIGHSMRALLGQDYRPLEVIVVDNASQDQSKSILARYNERIRLIENDGNAGFAAAQSRAKRRRMMRRRRASDEYLACWFHSSAASRPIETRIPEAPTQPAAVTNRPAKSLATEVR